MSESRPNPASATERALTAAMARMTIPATFHPSVAHSRAKPRRTRLARAGSLNSITPRACRAVTVGRIPDTATASALGPSHGRTGPSACPPPGRNPGGGRGRYGRTELTEVPQLAYPSRVPPQVPMVSVNADPVQLRYGMYSPAK
jgi:hypothetical protein